MENGLSTNEYFNPYSLVGRFYGSKFICPNSDLMKLKGTYASDDFNYLEIEIFGCDLPGDACSDISELNNLPINLITMSSHVDFEAKSGGDDVISYGLDTSNFLIMDQTNMIKSMNLFYQKSKVVLDDSPLKKYWKTEEIPIFEFK